MTLQAGNAACTNGLSKRIFDYRVGDPASGYSDPLTTPQADMLKADCFAIARAVVDEITANGQAVITTATDALQKVPGGADTLAPAGERTLALR